MVALPVPDGPLQCWGHFSEVASNQLAEGSNEGPMKQELGNSAPSYAEVETPKRQQLIFRRPSYFFPSYGGAGERISVIPNAGGRRRRPSLETLSKRNVIS